VISGYSDILIRINRSGQEGISDFVQSATGKPENRIFRAHWTRKFYEYINYL
jgi:hypothetical protein